MPAEEIRRRSRFMIRVLEWDDPRARYPNVWREGMPCQILAFETVASRLRLGDLIAVCYPASQKYAERSERFVGIGRVTGVRRAHDPALGWVDLETAHRFDPPLDLGETPRRVFLCCDPGWPGREVTLFRRVFDAAVAAGWRPSPLEEDGVPRGRPTERVVPSEAAREAGPREEPGAIVSSQADGAADGVGAAEREASPVPSQAPFRTLRPVPKARAFGGADYGGDMRDPKDGTWLALVELGDGERLRVVRLEPTGRTGLLAHLRDADSELMHVEAFGFDFPFGLPLPFAEALLGGPFPAEGWWALARRLEKMSRPEYLIALEDFRDAHGEIKRYTDEVAEAFSPLHRTSPDLGPMTYHGIRMIAEERSRYAVRPFESARGRLLLEVYPRGLVRRLGLETQTGEQGPTTAIVFALAGLEQYPVDVEEPFLARCLATRDALDAVLAARAAAVAALTGEANVSPEELAPDASDRLRKEGWIYGLHG